jgi:hypothetical protein
LIAATTSRTTRDVVHLDASAQGALILSKSDVSSWRLELVGDLGGLTESEEHESVQGATLH